MYKTLIVLLLLITSISADDLNWEKDLETAFSKATKQNKAVMIMVESSSCPWCIRMKERTLNDDNILERLDQFVLVKIDRDSVKTNYIPYAKYVPTIYFMTKEKKILERITGYFGVLDFNSWIDDVEKKLAKIKKQ